MGTVLLWAGLIAASLALTGAWQKTRARHWHAYWPVPFMLLGVWLGAADLAALAVHRPDALPPSLLVLGVWVAVVITGAGWIEIGVGRGRVSDWRTLVPPAILGAVGLTLVIAHAWTGLDMTAGETLSGVLLMLAGALLGLSRGLNAPVPPFRVVWPTVLALAMVVGGEPSPDRFAQARREQGSVLAGLQRAGVAVIPESPAAVTRWHDIPVETFRIDADTIAFFLIARDADTRLERDVTPRLSVPPPIPGISHLHVGPHILVVCWTSNWRLALQVEMLVRQLAGSAGRVPPLA